jgi:hypothetical protein
MGVTLLPFFPLCASLNSDQILRNFADLETFRVSEYKTKTAIPLLKKYFKIFDFHLSKS